METNVKNSPIRINDNQLIASSNLLASILLAPFLPSFTFAFAVLQRSRSRSPCPMSLSLALAFKKHPYNRGYALLTRAACPHKKKGVQQVPTKKTPMQTETDPSPRNPSLIFLQKSKR